MKIAIIFKKSEYQKHYTYIKRSRIIPQILVVFYAEIASRYDHIVIKIDI